MTIRRFEMITGPQRRRRWSLEEKRRILAEAAAPEANVSAVARRHDLHGSQLFRWRHEMRLGRLDGTAGASDGELVPVQIAPEALAPHTGAEPPRPQGRIEIELSNGRKLRVDQEVDAQALRRVIAVLEDA